MSAAGPALPHLAATRYVSPLREGGSLPGLLEADDDGIYVVKWTGAGQGPLALAAEALRPFPALREHVLADTAEPLSAAHERLAAPALAAIEEAVSMIPEDWLVGPPRAAYADFLRARLAAAPWLKEAQR